MRLIDADYVMEALRDLDEKNEDVEIDTPEVGFVYGIRTALEIVDFAPTFSNHGHWIFDREKWPEGRMFRCSACGLTFAFLNPRNFCPSCGATMDEETETE